MQYRYSKIDEAKIYYNSKLYTPNYREGHTDIGDGVSDVDRYVCHIVGS